MTQAPQGDARPETQLQLVESTPLPDPYPLPFCLFDDPPANANGAKERRGALYRMYGSAYWYAISGIPQANWPDGWKKTVQISDKLLAEVASGEKDPLAWPRKSEESQL